MPTPLKKLTFSMHPPRASPKSLPHPKRSLSGGARAVPGGSREVPEPPWSVPGTPPEHPRRSPGAPNACNRAPVTSKRRPGTSKSSLRRPPGPHFGASGSDFPSFLVFFWDIPERKFPKQPPNASFQGAAVNRRRCCLYIYIYNTYTYPERPREASGAPPERPWSAQRVQQSSGELTTALWELKCTPPEGSGPQFSKLSGLLLGPPQLLVLQCSPRTPASRGRR